MSSSNLPKLPDWVQPVTPEIIDWIPGIPEKVLHLTKNTWIKSEELCNRIKKIGNDSILNDSFSVNIEWDIVVRKDSEILKWHFSNLPIVPWVNLVKLYKVITWKNLYLWDKIMNLDGIMIIPWHSITIKEDWLYQKNIKVLSISENLQIPFNSSNLDEYKKDKVIWPKNNVEIDPNLFLLQSDPIILAKSCELECHGKNTPNIWDKIKWEINPKMIDDNWNVDKYFLTEWAAQVLSSWISYMLNWWETREQKWEKFEFLTFRSLSVKQLFNVEKWQWPFRVEAELINVEKREITWIYKIVDKSWEIIQEWTISWTTMKKSVLSKSFKTLTNNLEKDKLSNKVKNVLKNTDIGLSNFFVYNEENWTLIAKKDSINLNFFKILYSEVYDLNISSFPKLLLNTKLNVKINPLDVIEIKTDWLYQNWKPMFWVLHHLIRLYKNNKLSSIFSIDTNSWEINLQIPLDNEKIYNGEHIWDLLSELQNTLLPWNKINFYKNHFINNSYIPNKKLFFDSNWIYTSEKSWDNTEKRYFFWKIEKSKE